MYPSVMPQSELLAKLEDTADLAKKSWALRKPIVADAETTEEEEEEEESSSSSGSESGTTVLSRRRPSETKRASMQPQRRNTGSPREGKEEQRPKSSEREAEPTRPTPFRSRSSAPDVQSFQRGKEDTISKAGATESHDARGVQRRSRARSSAAVPDRRDRQQRRVTPPRDALKPSVAERPNALTFLDDDSPEVTEEDIRRVIAQSSGQWSPRSASSSSSSNDSIDQRSTAETDATTPDQSINGDAPAQTETPEAEVQEHRYGTPEMTRGPMKHPHLPPKELQPRVAAPGQGHAKHLPRAEKLPMSGYELLAAKLSTGGGSRPRRRGSIRAFPSDEGDQHIKPIYRRFEALNHRLLLHLQDELSELEEQLHRLDTADTQTRRLANCILPASRRAEFMAGGELQWHKTDILGKIGYKLGQYNHVLTSFKEAQTLPPASLDDVETYRTYLATKNPIAEIETRFLDPAEDLICLAPPRHSRTSSSSSSSSPSLTEDMLTPMPLKTTFGFSPSPASTATASRKSSVDETKPQPAKVTSKEDGSPQIAELGDLVPGAIGQVSALCALAIVGPILAFPFVADFVGRMAVVLVVGLAVAALRRRMLDSQEIWSASERVVKGDSGDLIVVVGVYGAVMAALALLV